MSDLRRLCATHSTRVAAAPTSSASAQPSAHVFRSVAVPLIVRQEDALSSSVPENASPSPILAPPRQRLIVAEITCLLCARPVGIVTTEHWPPRGPVAFRPAGSPIARQVAAIWRLRCPVCGGNTAVDDLTERTVRCEDPADWQADVPRRGRPPKSLVDVHEDDNADTSEEPDGFAETTITCQIAAHWLRVDRRGCA
jgi:hypothetical protein